MHIFSVLLTAQTVDKDLRTVEGRQTVADWCRASGITKIYVESFRRIFIEEDLLKTARDFFEDQGFEVDGCVTTVGFPKPSANYEDVACYTHLPNLELLERIFRRTAAVFNTIMIDDFLFTACDCDECKAAAAGRSIEDFHSDLMHEVSVERILNPAKEVNPACKLIIKYPNWYDRFHARGYEVIRQTEVFDYIWAGNETREPGNARWGRYPQTQAFFLQTWDQKISCEKCGGGWYDWIETKPETYLEQARNTILGGARESMLFCYHGLTDNEVGLADNAAFRAEREGLHKLAYLISGKKPVGVAAPKQMDVDPLTEPFIYGYLGMIGIPAVADIALDPQAAAMVLGPQAAKFPNVRRFAQDFHRAGKTLALTRGFVEQTGLSLPGVPVLDPQGGLHKEAADSQTTPPSAGAQQEAADNWGLLDMPNREEIRDTLLSPLGVKLSAPTRVALNLYDDDMELIQNFNDEPVEVSLDLGGRNRKARSVKLVLSEDRKVTLKRSGTRYDLSIPARTLALLY